MQVYVLILKYNKLRIIEAVARGKAKIQMHMGWEIILKRVPRTRLLGGEDSQASGCVEESVPVVQLSDRSHQTDVEWGERAAMPR